jgi:hypothetical protein
MFYPAPGRKTVLAVLFLLLVLGGILLFIRHESSLSVKMPNELTAPTPAPPTGEVACTMEAKQCPDGSYVGRTGPTCEFTACPVGENAAESSPSQSTDTDNDKAWTAIKAAINACETSAISQTHAGQVMARLKSGQTLSATEPQIDEIITLAANAAAKCGRIQIATE